MQPGQGEREHLASLIADKANGRTLTKLSSAEVMLSSGLLLFSSARHLTAREREREQAFAVDATVRRAGAMPCANEVLLSIIEAIFVVELCW